MSPDIHAMLAALFDAPREYIEALAAAGTSPEKELAEALADSE